MIFNNHRGDVFLLSLFYSKGSGGNKSLGEQLRTFAISLSNNKLYLAFLLGLSTSPIKPFDTLI